MATAREALNARVRDLIDHRLGGGKVPEREEAAEYVRLLQVRGISRRQIAERVGVPRATVDSWAVARWGPGSSTRFDRLAMFARNAMQLPVIEPPALTGMRLVIDTLRRVRRSSQRQLACDLGYPVPKNRGGGNSPVTRWMAGVSPSRRATLRILRLVREVGLPPPFVEICTNHLREVTARQEAGWKFDPLRNHRREAARQLRAEGLSIAAIAERVGVTCNTAAKYCRKAARPRAA